MKKLFILLMLIFTLSITSQAQRAEGFFYVTSEHDTIQIDISADSINSIQIPDTLDAYLLVSDLNQIVRTPFKKNDKIHYVDMMEGYIVDHGWNYEVLDYEKQSLDNSTNIIIWDWRIK